jgi:hypothetical protein
MNKPISATASSRRPMSIHFTKVIFTSTCKVGAAARIV